MNIHLLPHLTTVTRLMAATASASLVLSAVSISYAAGRHTQAGDPEMRPALSTVQPGAGAGGAGGAGGASPYERRQVGSD